MEAERKASSLRRGGSLNRLGSSSRLASTSFVSRQRQLLEGHKIEGGVVRKTSFATEKEQVVPRKSKKQVVFENSDSNLTGESLRTTTLVEKVKGVSEKVKAENKVEKIENLNKDNFIENKDSNCKTSGSERKIPSPRKGVLVRSQRITHEMNNGQSANFRQHSRDRLVTKSNSPRTLQSGLPKSIRQISSSPAIRPASAQANLEISEQSKTDTGLDVSLKLHLEDLIDSDNDENDSEEDKDEVVSPRKTAHCFSPRKSILASTKSFEAKSSLICRRDSDTSLIKPKYINNRTLSVERSVPVVQESEAQKSVSNEISAEAKPVLVKRTSSGRKLPIPNEKLTRSISLKKSESDNSFLSISKDGNTEYVSLDLPSTFSDHNNLQPSEFIEFVATVSQTDMNTELRMKQKAESKKLVSKNGVAGTENGVKSPPVSDTSAKPPLEKKTSRSSISGAVPPSPRGSTTSPRKIIAASPRSTAAAAGNKGNNSSKVSMGTRAPSPRGSQAAVSRASPRERATTPRSERAVTPRATTPRIDRATTPRADRATTPRSMLATDRRASKENLRGSDTDLSKKHTKHNTSDSSMTNGTVTDSGITIKRRNSSGGGLTSPRPGSPVKGKHLFHGSTGSLQSIKIDEEPVRPRYPQYDSCQQMDLQSIIATFQVHLEVIEQQVNYFKLLHLSTCIF